MNLSMHYRLQSKKIWFLICIGITTQHSRVQSLTRILISFFSPSLALMHETSSVKFKVLGIYVDTYWLAILKNSKYKQAIVNSKLSMSVYSRPSLRLYFSVVFCTWTGHIYRRGYGPRYRHRPRNLYSGPRIVAT